jgi:hypothetical protein
MRHDRFTKQSMWWLFCVGQLLIRSDAGINRQLVLREIDANELPTSMRVAGGAIRSNGRSVIWGADGRSLVETGNGSVSIRCPGFRGHFLAAGILTSGAVEVIDTLARSVLSVRQGVCIKRRDIKVPGRIVAAALLSDGWLVGTEDLQGRPGLWYVDEGENNLGSPASYERVDSLDWHLEHLTSGPREAYLTSIRWPYQWRVVRTGEGRVSRRRIAVSGVVGRASAEFPTNWSGLPVFPLDSGFVRVVADPRSDARILVLLDSLGAEIRRSRMDVAFGIVATNPSAKLLLATRRTDKYELVTFRWHWE